MTCPEGARRVPKIAYGTPPGLLVFLKKIPFGNFYGSVAAHTDDPYRRLSAARGDGCYGIRHFQPPDTAFLGNH
jgi:hypothetical protein